MQCPCSSKKSYADCCQKFHSDLLPTTPLELMRSRYSAYALKKADYIIDTTHPLSPYYESDKEKWKVSILAFCDNTKFTRLEIVDFGDDWVHFKAYLGELILDEKSTFQKEDGKWLYVSGTFN